MDETRDDTAGEWSGSPWSKAPDEFWVDDATNELVCAKTGKRLPPAARRWSVQRAREVLAEDQAPKETSR